MTDNLCEPDLAAFLNADLNPLTKITKVSLNMSLHTLPDQAFCLALDRFADKDRIFMQFDENGAALRWYFSAREGNFGPYDTRLDALQGMNQFVQAKIAESQFTRTQRRQDS